MLDQNTDRMWYVIGAVIVGAAIILILNGTAPQIFASVVETFKGKTEEVTTITDGIGPKARNVRQLTDADMVVGASNTYTYDRDTGTWTLELIPMVDDQYQWSYGLTMIENQVVVPYGKTLTMSYEIYIPEGVQVHARTDVSNYPVSGKENAWSGNDNDNSSLRTHNGKTVQEHIQPLTPGDWTTISYSFSNTHSGNSKKEAMYDKSRIGAYNNTGDILEVKIRNAKVRIE